MKKIFISAYPFAKYNTVPLEILKKENFEITQNPYPRKLNPKELLNFASNVDGIIAGTENLKLLIEKNLNLKIISRVGIGLDSVPLNLCKKKKISVSYTPDAMTQAVVELTFGLMIDCLRHITFLDKEMRLLKWNRFCGKQMSECIFGIIGVGRIGKKVIELLQNFYPKKILINDIEDRTDFVKTLSADNIFLRTKEEIYQKSDIISLHLPLNKKSKKMINQQSLSLFNSNSYLINTSRGDLVCEESLYEVLVRNKIKGAALDVFTNEPYRGKLTELKNIILTHHIGSCSNHGRFYMELQASQEIVRFFKNQTLKQMVPNVEYENSQD